MMLSPIQSDTGQTLLTYPRSSGWSSERRSDLGR